MLMVTETALVVLYVIACCMCTMPKHAALSDMITETLVSCADLPGVLEGAELHSGPSLPHQPSWFSRSVRHPTYGWAGAGLEQRSDRSKCPLCGDSRATLPFYDRRPGKPVT